MEVKEEIVDCFDCVCRIKDAENIFDAYVVGECSSPKPLEYAIFVKGDEFERIISGYGCCNSSVYIRYEQVALFTDTTLPERKNGITQSNHDFRETQTLTHEDGSPRGKISSINHQNLHKLTPSKGVEPKYLDKSRQYSSPHVYYQNTFNTTVSNDNGFNDNLNENHWNHSDLPFPVFLSIGLAVVIMVSCLICIIVRRAKNNRKGHVPPTVSEGNLDTEYSTIADVNEIINPCFTPMHHNSLAETISNQYFTLECQKTYDRGVQCDIFTKSEPVQADDNSTFLYYTLERKTKPPINTVCLKCCQHVPSSHTLQRLSLPDLKDYAAHGHLTINSSSTVSYDTTYDVGNDYAHLNRKTQNSK